MNWALLLLAICSTDVTCSRTLTVPRSIERSLVRLGAGVVATYGDQFPQPTLAQLLEGNLGPATIRNARLYVDAERSGYRLCRVLRGIATLGLFVLDRSAPGDAVELTYTLGYRGLRIARSVEVTEGQIVSRAAFACAMGPQGRCRAVWFRAVARESPRGTIITLTCTARCNTGVCPSRSTSRFQAVNRLAGREIERQLDATLAEVEREGRTISANGHDALVEITRSFLDRFIRKIGVDRR
jgi:hypothetical protein